MSKDLEKKTAEEILDWALHEYGDKVALASSFGAEDVVLIDMLVKIDLKAHVFTLDTGRLPQETYDVMENIRKKYGIEFEIYYPEERSVKDMVGRYGIDLFYRSIELRKLCCQVRKIEPLNRALSNLSAWICGLRREQAVTRTELKKIETDQAHGGIIKVNPLADWTEKDVWDYIKTNDVPYNALHDKGYPSIGCAPCTRSIKPGEDIRAGRWWWERPEQKECGLHCVVCPTPEKMDSKKRISGLICPHGGKLVNRIIAGEEKKEVLTRIHGLKRIDLNPRQISDLEMISIGGFSPLEGFMGQADYKSVVEDMRLANGLAWTIPITLAVSREVASKLEVGDEVGLFDEADNPLGTLLLDEIYSFDKQEEARLVYRTTDEVHPGVGCLKKMGDFLLAGKIKAFPIRHQLFLEYRLSPTRTREIFEEKGWRRVAAFQTRNPIHRAHEYIQKCALEVVDGLFVHPIVGEVKEGDLSAQTRMKAYEVLIEKYYPRDRVLLAVNPASMRYAGPREAIFHAIVRKNYGCTHFIVGRDHAGVGNYYGPFDAQHIFDEFEMSELGIIPLFFDHTFYCKQCEGMASAKTCPHAPDEHLILSGTRVREMLEEGVPLPEEFTRPEVARVLMEEARKGETE